MRKTFLKKARETLQEMRTQLLRNVQAELHEGRLRIESAPGGEGATLVIEVPL